MVARAFEDATLVTRIIIPCLVFGLLGLASYTIFGQLCVNYLLFPQANGYPLVIQSQPRIAVGIIASFPILLVISLAIYLRLLYLVVFDPGYIPRSKRYFNDKPDRFPALDERRISQHVHEKQSDPEKGRKRSSRKWVLPGYEDVPDIADLLMQDVFVCNNDGLPPWCSQCLNFKPHRAHHNSDTRRCVDREDHYCPWAGGAISRTNYKSFVQFLFWAALLCIYTFILVLYFLVQQIRLGVQSLGYNVNPLFVVTVVLAFLFGWFTAHLCGFHLMFIWYNRTNIEHETRSSRIWSLAVHVPTLPTPGAQTSYQTKTFVLFRTTRNADTPVQPETRTRTFAILHSERRENPFDLGPMANFKSILGDSVFKWFLPFSSSPIHYNPSIYGPLVEKMKKRAGIE